jgi:HSP20 family protein
MKTTDCCNTAECAPKDVATIRPAYQSRETEDGVTLSVALPGVERDGLGVTFHDEHLLVEGERKSGGERRYRLRLRLSPRLDGESIGASLADGVLSLNVPLRESAKPREITVG